jgi:CTP-dependent riboflavin kinase
MNALSIVCEEERSLKKYCSRIPNSYWVMELVCNEDLSVMGAVCKGGGRGRKYLILKIYTHIFICEFHKNIARVLQTRIG